MQFLPRVEVLNSVYCIHNANLRKVHGAGRLFCSAGKLPVTVVVIPGLRIM